MACPDNARQPIIYQRKIQPNPKMKNFHDKFEDMDEYELEGELHQFLWDDNQDKLLELLHEYLCRRGNQFGQELKKALSVACKIGAVKCVTALINGKPPLHVDIHSPCNESLFPLHMAAQSHHPGITELLLYHGARTDVRCECSENDRVYLPLHFALNQLSDWVYITSWRPGRSIFMLLMVLGDPLLRNTLENIGLLAWKTKETEEEFLRYASHGQVVEAAALLIVARKKLIDLVPIVCRAWLTQINAQVGEDEIKVILQLLDVFERAGCEIEAYAKKEKLNVNKLEVITEFTSLLQKSGFDVTPRDAVIVYRQMRRNEDHSSDLCSLYSCRVEDIGMPHYSKSGYRWIRSMQPAHNDLKFPEVSVKKQWKDSWIPVGPLASRGPSVSIASAASKFHTSAEAGSDNGLKRFGFNLSNLSSSKPWASFAPFIKRLLKH